MPGKPHMTAHEKQQAADRKALVTQAEITQAHRIGRDQQWHVRGQPRSQDPLPGIVDDAILRAGAKVTDAANRIEQSMKGLGKPKKKKRAR
jgi:hypothetical protein